eukprot:jgi/Botrbrau1/1764/Bobra.0217s0019.1
MVPAPRPPSLAEGGSIPSHSGSAQPPSIPEAVQAPVSAPIPPQEPIPSGDASAAPVLPQMAPAEGVPSTSAGPSDTPMPAPTGPSEAAAAPAQPTISIPGVSPEDLEGIDLEFLSELPPEIQREVVEQQRRERRRRQASERAQQNAAASSGATGGSGGAAPGVGDMDTATVLATFPPDVREEVLMTADDSVLATLPPNVLAEAQRLRERAHSSAWMAAGPGYPGFPLFARRQHVLRSPGNPPMLLPPTVRAQAAAESLSASLHHRVQHLSGLVGRGRAIFESQLAAAASIDNPPLVDEEGLAALVSLLRLSTTVQKSQLHKLFGNLSWHPLTRTALLRLLLALLRMPLSADEAEGSQHGRLQRPLLGSPAPTSLAAALEVSQDAEPMAEELSLFPVSGLGPGSPTGDVELPPPVSRKVLEVITFLARHQPKVARELAVLDVPSPRAQSYQIALMQDKKGKRRAIEAHDFGPEQGAMEVLLELLGKSLCRRSSSHQEQVLQLMVLVLQAAHTAYQTLQEVYNKQNPVAAARQADSEALAAGTEAEAAARPSFLANSPDGPGTTPDGMFTPARPALEAGPTGSSAVTAGPSAFGAPSGAEPSTSADTPAEVPADHRHNPRPVLERLPPALVRQLPALLGDATTSDAASARTAEAIELLVKTAPSHKNLVLRELETQLQTMTASAVRELEEVRDGKQASMGRCSVGGLVCRLLQCVTVITKTGPSKTPPEKVLPEDTASLDEIAAQLDPLWAALSRACSHIEASLQGQWPPGGDSPAATRILPPGASQVLPLVEAFFVLSDARARHLGPLPDRIALRGASIERELVVPMDPIPLFTPISSTSGIASTSSGLTGGVAPTTASLEAHLPYIRFAEKHRRLLNTLVRHTPSLLEGSLTSLLRTPRLIEFDNKRTYFRSRVRTVNSDEGARHYGNLRICVRREHVFEDSFHQLRMRAPEEMKTKMAVTFQGEEGIDAGGVSREWYQVMAREMFNPNFSLFIPMPEGVPLSNPTPTVLYKMMKLVGPTIWTSSNLWAGLWARPSLMASASTLISRAHSTNTCWISPSPTRT